MKEFPINLKMDVGLRQESRGRANRDGLTQALGVRPILEEGLERLDRIMDPWLTPKEYVDEWPFPQIFRGMSKTLYCEKEAIYYLTESDSGFWTKTAITLSGNGDGSITAGGPWQFVDYYDVWFLFNGTCHVYCDATGAVTARATPTIRAGTSFRGRAVFGGFDSDYWSSDWLAEWARLAALEPTGVTLDLSLQTNMVWWSLVGGGNLFWLYDLDGAQGGPLGNSYSEHSETWPMYIDMLRRGDSGYAVMPWRGSVRNILPFEKTLVVYGDEGVTGLTPHVEPVPTFGQTDITRRGLEGRGAAGTNRKDTQVYLDESGVLWSIDAQFKETRLGYKEFFKPMMDTDIVIVHRDDRKEFHISNEERSYVLGAGGLTQSSQRVSSIFTDRGEEYGTYMQEDDFNDVSDDIATNEMRVRSGVIDMGMKANKALRYVTMDIEDLDDARVNLHYRGEDKEWRVKENIPIYEGVAMGPVVGKEFMVEIVGSPGDEMSIGEVEARWALSDKRFVRGAFGASKVNA